MGVRGIIRDVIGVYIGFEVLRGYIYKSFQINQYILISAIILFILSIWILLEKIGILAKVT